MSDFQDFLTRQFSHVALGEFQSGKFDEAQSLYEAAVATYAQGFQGAYLLREPDSDRGISIILWNSVEAMEAHQTEAHDAILKKMAPLFKHPPQTAFYEVVCHMTPEQA